MRFPTIYAQSDQSIGWSFEYSMSVKLLTEHPLEFLSLKKRGTQTRLNLHLSKRHFVGNHMSCIINLYGNPLKYKIGNSN